MRIASIVVLAVVLALPAAAGELPAPESYASVSLPPELQRILRDYESAWQARDAERLASLFASDGYVLPNGAPPARGRKAIAAEYAGAGGPLSLRAIAFGVDGTTGYIIGGFATETGKPDLGKFVLVVKKGSEGRWEIVADIDNMNRRPGPSPQGGAAEPSSAPR
jgi:ketosteroid isomerase-like protein